jgi:hypothetical protein
MTLLAIADIEDAYKIVILSFEGFREVMLLSGT